MDKDPPETWRAIAEILSTMPTSMAILLSTHQERPGTGRCKVCTRLGAGQSSEPWPCPVWKLADHARQIANQRGGKS